MNCKEGLEKRMYFLVPYNISPIQQAIQAGHAALEYANKYYHTEDYKDFMEKYKTWIILNGGTTNLHIGNEGIPQGTLDQAAMNIILRGDINYALFQEPDLNNALTAICLIVDERVFNREDYPDFKEWVLNTYNRYDDFAEGQLKIRYNKYMEEVGEDIAFLKELLNTKKLA